MGTKEQYLKFRIGKGYRRLIRAGCSKLYRDTDRDINKSILVAGAARSGTTWLADIIASQVPCRIMFEPFHSKLIEQYRQFNYYQYMRPEVDNDELYAYAHKIFSGDIRDPWIDRQVETIFPKYRLIKAVRINLFLKWLHDKFLAVPQIFVIRHPCAVVLSRLRLGWATDADIEPFLSQEELVEDYLSDKMDIVERAKTDEEKHTVIWCISNLVPVHQFRSYDFNVIFYEDLCIKPEAVIPDLFKSLTIDYQSSVYGYVSKPSTTSLHSSAVLTGEDQITSWATKLSKEQITNILSIVDDFGLGYIYGDSFAPLVSKLKGNQRIFHPA